MANFNLNDVLCFDCETTGIPEKGMKWDEDFLRFPRPVTMAWAFGDTERHEIIRPQGWDIPTETVAIHGVTTEQADKEGKPFVEVVTEFLNDAEKYPLICAHNVYFDTSIIKAAIMALCPELADKADSALFKGKRIDTMRKTIKFVGARKENGSGKFPTLEELFAKLFDGATFPAHNALEDVRALRKCLPPLVEMGIVELVQKEYPAESLEQKPEILDRKTPIMERKTEILERNPESSERCIEFDDPNPVTQPIGETAKPFRFRLNFPEQQPETPTTNVTNELLNENDF